MRDRIINISAFIILSALWLGFMVALVANPETLNHVWLGLRGLPLMIQSIVWLLTLQVMLGLWIWQTSWPLALRLVLILGLAWGTIYTFFPKKNTAQSAVASAKP